MAEGEGNAAASSLADFIVQISSQSEEQNASCDWQSGVKSYFHENHDPNLDDLIFFVRGSNDARQTLAEAEREESNEEMYAKALGGSDDLVFVKRRSKYVAGKLDPAPVRIFPDSGVRWQDTFCLNVILQLRYTVTVAVGTMTNDRFTAAEKVVADAFPSISRPESVVKKGQTLHTYPLLCFTFENFDDLFEKIVVNKDQAVVFQLQVHGGVGPHLDLDQARAAAQTQQKLDGAAAECVPAAIRTTIFEGGVPYDKLQHGHSLRRASMIDFRNTDGKMAFLPMRGPGGKGRAEVGVVVSENQPEVEGDGVEPAVEAASGREEADTVQRALSSVGSWFSAAAAAAQVAVQGPKIPENPALKVLLTTVTIHWRTIWRDLAMQLDSRESR
eukprot:SAG11_NODE_1241_length_5412_cov_24.745718_2_plen_387_part_00